MVLTQAVRLSSARTPLAGQAARRGGSRVHTSLRAVTSASMSASLCNGDGVRRGRSVPRGTVG
jgi:hypothetical protein